MSALCNGGSVLPVIIWFWMHTWMTGHMVPQLWRYMNLHWTNRPTSGGRIGRQMHSSFNYLRIAAWQKKKKEKSSHFFCFHPSLLSLFPVSLWLGFLGWQRQKQEGERSNDGIKRVRKMTEKERKRKGMWQTASFFFAPWHPQILSLAKKREEKKRKAETLCLQWSVFVCF